MNWNDILLKLAGAEGIGLTQTVHSVVLETWLPAWLLPFLLAGAGFAAFALYRREKSLKGTRYVVISLLRMLAYWTLILLIAAPQVRVTGEGVRPGRIPMILDASGSMSIKDAPDKKRRLDQAITVADLLLRHADDPALGDVKVAGILEGKECLVYPGIGKTDPAGSPGNTQPVVYTADGEYTSLAKMLNDALESNGMMSCPGIILLSDGANNVNDGLNNVLAKLHKKRIPVYLHGVGTTTFRDLSIFAIQMDHILFLNEKCRADIRLHQTSMTGETVHVTAQVEGQEVYRGDHKLSQEGDSLVKIEFTPAKTGVFELHVKVDPLVGEATEENNVFVKNFRVIDQKIRVLLAFGTPSWEYRYLVGAFSRDQRVEYKSFLLDADERRTDSTVNQESVFLKKLPASKEELNRNYDLIFLSGLDMGLIEPGFSKALREYIEESSGGVVFCSDPYYIPYTLKNTPLEELIPVTIPRVLGRTYSDELDRPALEPLKFQMTDDGIDNELLGFSADKVENRKIWELIPPVYTVYRQGRLKPGAMMILAAFKNERQQKFPAIIMSSYGRGNVLFMGFDSTWRWRKEFGDRFFRDFWGKAVQTLGLPHLLNESMQSVLFVSNENCRVGERLGITARVFDQQFKPHLAASVAMKISDPKQGKEETIELAAIPGRDGMYRGDYIPKENGILNFSLDPKFGARDLSVRVLSAKREFVNCTLDMPLLEMIAKETGGKVFSMEEASTLIQTIAESRKKDILVNSFTIWDSPFMMILAILMFCLEWILRKLYSLD